MPLLKRLGSVVPVAEVMEEGILDCEKDAGKTQFQYELNRLFESRGIIADLRSHLRHLMITALQSRQAELKPTDRSSPKAQALNLMVAEYLFRHGCHYTLSVFTSEVPTLASFNPEVVLRDGKPSEANKKRLRGNCFQENEVEEIFNALGMSSHEKELSFLKASYLEKGNQISLVELFLQTVVEMSIKLHIRQNLESHVEVIDERILSDQWSKKIVDILMSEKLSPPQVTALEEVIFRMTENEIRRIVEQTQRQQMQILSEREKRIQEYLKKHEDDIIFRLLEAEKDLTRRRDMIDEELTEREKHLTQMAVEWKDKHEEILKLSKNFHDIKDKNQDLEKKLKALEEENIRLKSQEKSQNRTINDLKVEFKLLINELKEVTESNAGLRERVQALISKENKEVIGHHDFVNQKPTETSLQEIPLLWPKTMTSCGDVNVINCHKESSPKLRSKEFTMTNQMLPHSDQSNITEIGKTNLGSGEAQTSELLLNNDSQEDEDVSSNSSEDIVLGFRKKLQDLEEETNRINQNYLEYKLKRIPIDSDSEDSRNYLDKSSQSSNEFISKETRFSQTNAKDTFIKLQKLKEKKERKNELNLIAPLTKKLEDSPRKPAVRTPTKRQLQNRDFFLKSRQLLQAFENQKVENSRSSPSVVDSTTTSSCEELVYASGKLKNKSPVKSVSMIPLRTPSTQPTEAPEIKITLTESPRKIESSSHKLRDDTDCLALLEQARIKSPPASSRKSLRQRILLSESEEEEVENERKKEKVINCTESIVVSDTSTPSEKVSVGTKSESDGFLHEPLLSRERKVESENLSL